MLLHALQDTILLAGDVSDDLAILKRTFQLLKSLFKHVFFVPGNHDLWVRKKECEDSLVKLKAILSLCKDVNVHTQPLVGR